MAALFVCTMHYHEHEEYLGRGRSPHARKSAGRTCACWSLVLVLRSLVVTVRYHSGVRTVKPRIRNGMSMGLTRCAQRPERGSK